MNKDAQRVAGESSAENTDKMTEKRLLATLGVTVVLLASLSGCATSCQKEAEGKFAIIDSGIGRSIPKGWIIAYDETSGCDSGDDPWVTIELMGSVSSPPDVANQMARDGWMHLSDREAAPYIEGGQGSIVLSKKIDAEKLVATIRNYENGPTIEIGVEG